MDWSKFDLAISDPRFLHRMAPETVAKAYQIDLRLVTAVKQFAETEAGLPAATDLNLP